MHRSMEENREPRNSPSILEKNMKAIQGERIVFSINSDERIRNT